jgi:glycosyltransferase involved in cell wall biosynthesis
MVTKRMGSLHIKRAIESFKNQSFSKKELIVVYSHAADRQVYEIQCLLKGYSYLFYNISENVTLGEARNISIELANGNWVCQWDDDDISHIDRLEYQHNWNLLNDSQASILGSQYHLFENTSKPRLYIENRKKVESAVHSGWCGTILAKKDIMRGIYPHMKIEEDMKGLSKLKNLKVINDNKLFLYYLYSYHGDNTWDLSHNMYMIGDNNTDVIDNKLVVSWINDNFNIKI